MSVFISWCAVLALLGARAASGAIVAGLDGTQNTTSPANFSYWNNIGYVPFGAVDVGGTAIYLGNDWVLTAGHVQGGNNGGYTFVIPNLNNGQNAVFTPVFASQVPLVLSPGGPYSDVTLFRVQDDPLLHSLPTVQFGSTPQIGTGVTDIGSGYNRDATGLHYWKLSDVNHPDTATWTDVTGLPTQNTAQRTGYLYAAQPSFAKRWGTNTTVAVPGGGATFTFNNTQLFATVFDPAIANNSQLAPGDSGGGVFVNNRLVGLNLYKGDDSKDPSNPNNVGQPANTAVSQNASFYADLYTYVDQIANVTKLHPSIDGDANLDGVVDVNDFNIMYANLGTGSNWTQGDFNLDGKVDFLDFQTLESNFGKASAVGVQSGSLAAVGSEVPEPGTVSLLLIGATALLARRNRR